MVSPIFSSNARRFENCQPAHRSTDMNRILKTSILSAAVAATTLVTLPAAQAGDHWRHSNRHHYSRHSGGNDLAVAGLLGLAAGALVVGLSAREPAYREPVYAPRPRPIRDYPITYREPEVVYADSYASMEPWTPEWYQYCSDRYRSFNARSGTFTGYDGLKHFCVAN
jgi:hypothetical protein